MAQEEDSKRKNNPMLIVALVVIVILSGAAGWGYLYGWPWMDKTGTSEQQSQDEPLYFTMKPLVVNLVAGDSRRFLKARPVIMTRDAELLELMEQETPRLRSEMIRLLREQDPNLVLSVNGFDDVRKQMLALAQQLLGGSLYKSQVEDLFFTEFVVQ